MTYQLVCLPIVHPVLDPLSQALETTILQDHLVRDHQKTSKELNKMMLLMTTYCIYMHIAMYVACLQASYVPPPLIPWQVL